MEVIVEMHESVIECEERVLIIADMESKNCHGYLTVRKIDDRKLKRRMPICENVVVREREEKRFECDLKQIHFANLELHKHLLNFENIYRTSKTVFEVHFDLFIFHFMCVIEHEYEHNSISISFVSFLLSANKCSSERFYI